MILELLVYAAAATDADAANLVYVQCLFAQSRSAQQAGMSPRQFETMLAGRCRVEERALERSDGEATAAQEAREIVIEDYRRIVELGPELRRLGELCRANPEECRE